MPRPVDESRFRRFLMQAIMWIILGGTIAAAALVDCIKEHSRAIVLDAPKQLDGFTIRLPRGWRTIDDPDEQALATLQDPNFGDVLTVSVQRSSLSDVFTRFSRRRRNPTSSPQQVAIDGQTVRITMQPLYSQEGPEGTELRVTRALDNGQNLSISVITSVIASGSDANAPEYEINLIKQVALSVHMDQP